MAVTTGVAFVVKSDVSGGTPGQLAGQRGGTLTITTPAVDFSSKDSSVYRSFGRNLYEWEVSCDGLVLETDTDFTGLEADILAGSLVSLDIALPQVAATITFSGEAIPTNFSLNAPYDDAYTYSCTFKGTGALVKG